MTTTTDHHLEFEVFGDATFVDRADRFDDVLTEPRTRDRDLLTLTALAASAIQPSDLPAHELPDFAPTVADLLAIEAFADTFIEGRIASLNTLSAYEATRRDLFRPRAARPALALVDEPEVLDLGRAA